MPSFTITVTQAEGQRILAAIQTPGGPAVTPQQWLRGFLVQVVQAYEAQQAAAAAQAATNPINPTVT